MSQHKEHLAHSIKEQEEQIAHNKQYLREQQQLIDTTVEAGQNHIAQLTRDADELDALIVEKKKDLMHVAKQVDEKRLELAGLS